MLKNYFITALRNLLRHKLYSFINIGGLSIGLAACILIFLFVQNELSYDKWIPDSERIVRLEGKYKGEGGEPDNPMALSPGPLSKPLKANFGSMIEASTRMLTEEFLIVREDVKFLDTVNLVDHTFFDVLDLPMVAGDRQQMFADYKSVVISESAAHKYFGNENPVGQVLDLDFRKMLVKVVAVMKDLPTNSHLTGDIFIQFDETRYEDRPWVTKFWIASNVYTYMKLHDPAQRLELEAAIPPFLDKNAVLHPSASPDTIPSEVYQTRLMPIEDIHLHSTGRFQLKATGDILVVYSFSAIAILILLIAVINFTNLSTARASLRAREIALRKVVGASRGQVIAQFLGETFLTTLFSLLFAFVIVEVSLPWFNDFVTKLLSLSAFVDPLVQAGLVAMVAVVGLGAGAHPAFKVSGFRPSKILHSNSGTSGGDAKLRYALTTLQFSISTGLMIATAIVYSQIHHARDMQRGLEIDNKLTLVNMNYGPVAKVAGTLRQEIDKLAGVNATAFSERSLPLRSFWDWPVKVNKGDYTEVLDTEVVPAGHNFLEFYEAKLLAGRFFAEEFQADTYHEPSENGGMARQTAVISEKTVGYYGFGTPETAIGQTVYVDNFEGITTAITIVGVVEDMNLRSARDTADPLLFLVESDDMWVLNIGLNSKEITQTVREIEAVWNRIVPHFPLNRAFLRDNFNEFYLADEQRAEMFAYFSIFAILVSCLGLYGLASFTTEQRTKEIGVRKVLGAKVRDIVALLTLQFSKPVLIANIIAWPVTWYLADGWLSGFAYRIDLSPLYFLGAGGITLVIASMTVAGHAFKSASSNPVVSLRHG